MPITVAVPPGRSIAHACSAVTLRPIASKAYCTPPPVISRTCSTGSPADASTVSVAPNCFASSSLEATRSMAMTRPGAGEFGTVDRRQADAAAADHGHRRSRFDLSRAEDRADAGGHRAADHRGAVERHVLADLHHCVFMHTASAPRTTPGRRTAETGLGPPPLLGGSASRGSALLGRRVARLSQRVGSPLMQYSQ